MRLGEDGDGFVSSIPDGVVPVARLPRYTRNLLIRGENLFYVTPKQGLCRG